jgi:hypothetical protein
MLYYERIPEIVIDTVRSLYRVNYVDTQYTSTARLFDFIDTNTQLASIKLILSQLALVVSIVFAAFIIFVAIQRRALKAQAEDAAAVAPAAQEPQPIPTGQLRDRWNSILAYLDSAREADWKLAVMEADTLVDDSLARAGFAGATFGDRLSNIQPGTLLSLDGVWWAHKIRNRLAHEVDYFLRYTEARQAVGYFEAALAELQLI